MSVGGDVFSGCGQHCMVERVRKPRNEMPQELGIVYVRGFLSWDAGDLRPWAIYWEKID